MPALSLFAPLALTLAPCLLTTAPDVCAACVVERGVARLCATHTEAESSVLQAHLERVLDEDGKVAMDALDVLAAANAKHENAPSPALSKAIASGLGHDTYVVRAYAMSLLVSPGQDDAVTREALRAFAGAVPHEAARMDAEVRASYAAQLEQAPAAQDELGAELQALSRVLQGIGGDVEATFFGECCRMLSDYLGKGDDAALDDLVALARSVEDYSGATQALGPGLAAQGRRDAVVVAVQLAKAWQELRKELEADLKKAERLKLAKRPKSFTGSSKDWEARASAQREQVVARFRTRVEQHDRAGRVLHDALCEMVRARGLGDPPTWDDRPHTGWNAWLKRHVDQLPERIAPEPADD